MVYEQSADVVAAHADYGVDLIVMNIRERSHLGWLRRTLSSRIVERVAANTAVPVLTVPPAGQLPKWQVTNTNKTMYETETILIVTDGIEHSERTIDPAIEMAAACGTIVHTLYVVDIDWWEKHRDISDKNLATAGRTDPTDDRPPLEPAASDLTHDSGIVTQAAINASSDRGVIIASAVRGSQSYRTILAYIDEHEIVSLSWLPMTGTISGTPFL